MGIITKGMGAIMKGVSKPQTHSRNIEAGKVYKKLLEKGVIGNKAMSSAKANKKTMSFETDSKGVVQVKPSGKKTETEAYLKNREKTTTYKGTKFENKMRDKFNEARRENKGILTTPEVKKYLKGKK